LDGVLDDALDDAVDQIERETRDPEIGGIAEAIGSLARAVQRLRIYPPSSPICADAVDSCLAALAALPVETVEIRVAPSQLFVGPDLIPGPVAITELAERLFRADVEELSLGPGADPKEVMRFCRQLATWDRRSDHHASFAEMLSELGVDSITARSANKLEVLEIEVISSERLAQLAEERARRAPEDQLEGETRHQAWVQVDTDCDLDSIDLVDLAFLVENQGDLARVLHDIAEGGAESVTGAAALGEGVAELVDLYSSLSPRVSDQRFEDLAKTLMTLDEDTRRRLTQDVLLPDLLETGRAARLLRLLPDEEILEGVRTLGTLEVGAPGLVNLAFGRLALSEERNERLTDALLGSLASGDVGFDEEPAPSPLLSVDGSEHRDLREYTAFELAVDAEAAARLTEVKAGVDATDEAAETLRCCANLVRHVRNPDHVAEIMERVQEMLSPLISTDTSTAAAAIEELRAAADSVREYSPEVAESVDGLLLALCSPEFLQTQARGWIDQSLSESESRELLLALGPAAVGGVLSFLEDEPVRAIRRRMVDFMCDNAAALSPGLVPHLGDERWTVVRNVLRILGFAGPGHEEEIAPLVGHPEERVVREALLALARIGSPKAAELVVVRLEDRSPERRAMAEESIRAFPVEIGLVHARRLLADRGFVSRYPLVARSLVSRFVSGGTPECEDILRPLLSLRFRLWSPQLMALGWTAAAALKKVGR
jgi:hypothetical protein